MAPRDVERSNHDTNNGSDFEEPKPIVYCCSGIFTRFNFEHEQREGKEKDGHSKVDPIHSFETHQHVTIFLCLCINYLDLKFSFTESRNLLQLRLYAFCHHDARHSGAKDEDKSVDEPSYSGILAHGAATAQQT